MVLLGEYYLQETYFVMATSLKDRFALLRAVNISRFAIIFFGNPFLFKVSDLQEEGHFFTSSIAPLSKSDLYTSSSPSKPPPPIAVTTPTVINIPGGSCFFMTAG